MDVSCFNKFPDDARVWVYAFPHDLDEPNYNIIDSALKGFCATWQSHGAPVEGDYVIYKNRFVIVTGITDEGLSGCSKDSMVRVFKTLHIEHKLNALDDMLIHYRKDGQVVSVSRAAFDESCQNGEITPDTTVYNCGLHYLSELRAGKFECPFKDSWHASAFRLG